MDSVTPPSAVALHPVIVPLSYLLGTWRGQGEGGYPNYQLFRLWRRAPFLFQSWQACDSLYSKDLETQFWRADACREWLLETQA
ncbi:hypothetical protein OIU74_018653 [Salix koriyanagi]|uniref:THAP4-like heme-binding beta-barrel domain-containing protein n=1 Tax=Salix koriyanagi TaxID=2511006 RepID=A0A9Q0WS14_9ROSI|nr:hypothetical protein OIU74_018653 [Salix koriyanagi]